MLPRQLLKYRPCHANVMRIYYHSPRQARPYSNQAEKGSWSSRTLVPLAAGATGLAIGLYQNRKGDKVANPRSRDHPNLEGGKTIPDLNKLGLSDQIAYSPPPTSDEVTQQLNEGAWTYPETKFAAVSRYDGAQLASNSPCEDAYLHGTFTSPFGDGDWMTWAVFDGHCGWQLSNLLTKQLMPFVRRALGDIKHDGKSEVSEDAIHAALKSAFTTLDDSLVQSAAATIESDLSFPEKARRLEAAYAGACALLALFDPRSRNLTVASTGDCRAVLGRKSADGSWDTTELTVDQTGANPDEAARIQALFPDEPNIVKGGRVWGMQPSRTFGDGMWKWPSELKRTLRRYYNGLSLPSGVRYKEYKDGPYLTAEPMVNTVRVPDAQPSFLILATDGLWDTMTSAEAVDLVGRWIDWQEAAGPQAAPVRPASSPEFGPTILGWEQQCKYEESRATVQDANAAVHLMRNGLGGANEEMLRGALTFRYPNSRDIRDDITVQVVFFNPRSTAASK
ncbi:hypothetical protein DL765_003972 [Monosporascus sp. GIB2]|nr:hypothetical protein DL765_003972 [Monosporascus sp. GIB2]